MHIKTENFINTCRFPPVYLFKYIYYIQDIIRIRQQAFPISFLGLYMYTYSYLYQPKKKKNKLNPFLESENVLPPLSPFIITCWNHCLAVWAPAPQTLVNNSMTLMSSSALNSLSFLSSPLSAISQILSASLVPTPGKFLASCEWPGSLIIIHERKGSGVW